jgi:DNA-binding NarL/FixJ family response regulator
LPLPIAALARRVLRSGQPSAVVIPTRAGRRAGLEAALLSGDAPDQVAVVISQATADQMLDRLALVTALTGRERDVLRAAVRGESTRAIAGRLHISEQTVQTHLRSIFGKTGSHSRRELLGRLGA